MKRLIVLLLTIGSVFILDSLNSYNKTKNQLDFSVTKKNCKKTYVHFFEDSNIKQLTLKTKSRVRRYY